jgi:hypothetical protein
MPACGSNTHVLQVADAQQAASHAAAVPSEEPVRPLQPWSLIGCCSGPVPLQTPAGGLTATLDWPFHPLPGFTGPMQTASPAQQPAPAAVELENTHVKHRGEPELPTSLQHALLHAAAVVANGICWSSRHCTSEMTCEKAAAYLQAATEVAAEAVGQEQTTVAIAVARAKARAVCRWSWLIRQLVVARAKASGRGRRGPAACAWHAQCGGPSKLAGGWGKGPSAAMQQPTTNNGHCCGWLCCVLA